MRSRRNRSRGHRKNGWYIQETANVHWPGSLPWRDHRSAQRGHGYATEEEALRRANYINAHYNAHYGRGLPLNVRHV